jgi:GGDEF domain-containing protein
LRSKLRKAFLRYATPWRSVPVSNSLSAREKVEKDWPDIPEFIQVFRERSGEPGELIVVFLATFKPISIYGIPAVFSASAYLANMIINIAPPQAFIGRVNAFTTGLFLPGKSRDQADEFVALLRRTAAENDLELEPGEWVEIRVAVGIADVTGRESDSLEPIREAVRGAEADQARFPPEWKRSITIFDDEPGK